MKVSPHSYARFEGSASKGRVYRSTSPAKNCETSAPSFQDWRFRNRAITADQTFSKCLASLLYAWLVRYIEFGRLHMITLRLRGQEDNPSAILISEFLSVWERRMSLRHDGYLNIFMIMSTEHQFSQIRISERNYGRIGMEWMPRRKGKLGEEMGLEFCDSSVTSLILIHISQFFCAGRSKELPVLQQSRSRPITIHP
jgi:hypothetical protein